MLEIYRTVLGGGGALYCSSPVTSGRRFIDWLQRAGKNVTDIDGLDEKDKKSHFEEVVQPNCVHANEIIQRLRERTAQIIIDPTAMPHFPGWTQQDWRFFWCHVIERYASAALFVDDWQYSNGCVYEFWVAHKKRIPTMDERMRPLSAEEGVSLISDASAEMKRHGAPTVFMEEVLRDLDGFLPMLGGSNAK